MYLIWFLTSLGLLELLHLIDPRLLTVFGILKFQVKYLALLVFLSNKGLGVVLDGKSSQKYPVYTGVPQVSILDPTFSLLHNNDLPDDVICNIAICADDTTLYEASGI